jgi:hypothetical protein
LDPYNPQVGDYVEFNLVFGKSPDIKRTIVKVDKLLTIERENLNTGVKYIEDGVTRLFWEKLVKRMDKGK